MNKQISVERIFAMGDYQNLKVVDTVNEIPDAISTNPNAIKLLRYLQLVDIEWTYLQYQKLRLSQPKLSSPEAIDSAIAFIEEERTQTFEGLLQTIRERKEKEEEELKAKQEAEKRHLALVGQEGKPINK